MSKNKKKKNKPAMGLIKNPALDAAIEALKTGSTPEKQEKLNEEVKKAQLLAPVMFDVPVDVNGQTKVQPKEVKFFLLNTKDGKTLFPAFTSIENEEKMQFGEEKPTTIVRTIADYDRLLASGKTNASGIVLNPGKDNIIMPAALIGVITGRVKRPEAPAAPAVKPMYAEPSVYPTKMVNAVYEHCRTVEPISRVWLKAKIVGANYSFFLIVESEDQNTGLLADICNAAQPLARNVPVEAIFITPELEKEVIKDAVPLYDKNIDF